MAVFGAVLLLVGGGVIGVSGGWQGERWVKWLIFAAGLGTMIVGALVWWSGMKEIWS